MQGSAPGWPTGPKDGCSDYQFRNRKRANEEGKLETGVTTYRCKPCAHPWQKWSPKKVEDGLASTASVSTAAIIKEDGL